jgi:hypothetical protein
MLPLDTRHPRDLARPPPGYARHDASDKPTYAHTCTGYNNYSIVWSDTLQAHTPQAPLAL